MTLPKDASPISQRVPISTSSVQPGARRASEFGGIAQLLAGRYGPHAPGDWALIADEGPQGHSSATTLARLFAHRSVRRYQQQELEPGTLELLVAAAQSAASSSNLQLWSVLSVEDPESRRALSEVAGNQAHVRQCPLFLVWIADLHRAGKLAVARGLESEGLGYTESFLVASVDAALAAQNAVVAAEALGLGTVYIGALRNQPERVAEILGLPPNTFAVFGLCVGWPDPIAATAVKPRLPQSVVLHRDRYTFAEPEHAAVASYDELMRTFYAEQKMPVPNHGWAWQSAQRFVNAKALNGRHLLRDALKRLGFELK